MIPQRILACAEGKITRYHFARGRQVLYFPAGAAFAIMRLVVLNKRSSPPNSNRAQTKRSVPAILSIAYAVLIAYGSLFPLTGWGTPPRPLFSFLVAPWPAHVSRSDVLTNVVAYIPFGMLVLWALRRMRTAPAILMATATGMLLSMMMETAQMFLPTRTSSVVDLLMNTAGTIGGTLLGSFLTYRTGTGRRLVALRNSYFLPGRAVDAGLTSISLWICSQLSPFLPSMDVSSIRAGLAPLWHSIRNPASLNGYWMAAYGLDIAGLSLFAILLSRQTRGAKMWIATGFLAVLMLKPFIVTRQLSLEAVIGLAIGGIALLLPGKRNFRIVAAAGFIVAGFAVAELQVGTGALHAFNWVPFSGQIDDTVNGFGSILSGVWPFAVLGSLCSLVPSWQRARTFTVGGFLVAALTFGLEWHQQSIPGRYGDVTTILLALGGWFFPAVLLRWSAMSPDDLSMRTAGVNK